MTRPKTPLAERFWPKVDVRGPDECWPWLAAVNKFTRYGQIYDGEHAMLGAHRVSYMVNVGPIPDHLTIDHTCNDRLCMNPAHLVPCTTQENTQAAKERRTTCRRGHPKDGNTYVTPQGQSRCRACNTLIARERGTVRPGRWQGAVTD